MLYLLFRMLRKGMMSPSGQQPFSQQKAGQKLRKDEQFPSGFCLRLHVQNEMERIEPAEQEVYKSLRPAAAKIASLPWQRSPQIAQSFFFFPLRAAHFQGEMLRRFLQRFLFIIRVPIPVAEKFSLSGRQ